MIQNVPFQMESGWVVSESTVVAESSSADQAGCGFDDSIIADCGGLRSLSREEESYLKPVIYHSARKKDSLYFDPTCNLNSRRILIPWIRPAVRDSNIELRQAAEIVAVGPKVLPYGIFGAVIWVIQEGTEAFVLT